MKTIAIILIALLPALTLPAQNSSIPKADLRDLNGKIISGDLKPSTDTNTHLVLYKNFPLIGSIMHSHSEYASCWAQAGLGIPPLGITHANFFNGEIPCTKPLSSQYRLSARGFDWSEMPGSYPMAWMKYWP